MGLLGYTRWATEIDRHMTAVGASSATQYRYPINTPFAHKVWTDQQLVAYDEMSNALVPKAGGDAEAFRKLVKQASEENPHGADIYYCPLVCVARRRS